MPFYSTSVKSPQFRNLKYSIVNKCPIMGYYFSDLVDFAPYRGYNEVTVKETTKTITQNGSRRYGNMAATKEQERKALARIKKIVEELGENSYIGIAFEGCFEVAEENIENDFACSMKQRAEHAEMEAGKYKKMYEDTAADFEAAETTIAGLEQKVLSTAEGGAIKAILYHYQTEATRLADESAQRIVELADSPDTPEFRQAVQDNRNSKKRMEDSKALIQRVLDNMA